MHQLNIVSRIIECEENGWHDLLSKVDGITQSLIDNPSAAQACYHCPALLVRCR